MTDGEEFRGSGTFRVDREKALEKLSAFALEKGEQFLLPLARCAVAGGARELTVTGVTALTARFDGRLFTADDLRDPYGALFDEAPEPRRRHLATFLLTALRTGPSLLEVESGARMERLRLRVVSPREESLEPAAPGSNDTVVRLRWPLRRALAGRAAKAEARRAWAMTPRRFLIDGDEPPVEGLTGRPRRSGEDRGFRAVVAVPDRGASESSVTFCLDGVAVETVRTVLPGAQVRAWVQGPFATTASQSAIVEDEARLAALSVVGETADAFLAASAASLEAGAPHPPPREFLAPWLLESAAMMRRDGKEPPPELWRAAVLPGATGGWLPLEAFRREAESSGKAAWSSAVAHGAKLPVPVALLLSRMDQLAFAAVFPGAVFDATQLVESVARLR